MGVFSILIRDYWRMTCSYTQNSQMQHVMRRCSSHTAKTYCLIISIWSIWWYMEQEIYYFPVLCWTLSTIKWISSLLGCYIRGVGYKTYALVVIVGIIYSCFLLFIIPISAINWSNQMQIGSHHWHFCVHYTPHTIQ